MQFLAADTAVIVQRQQINKRIARSMAESFVVRSFFVRGSNTVTLGEACAFELNSDDM